MNTTVSKRGIGVVFNDHGSCDLNIWAPLAEKVDVVIYEDDNKQNREKERISLQQGEYGYWSATTQSIRAGVPYKIAIDGKDSLPDPVSLYQPSGVHGSSVAFDAGSYQWKDNNWSNPSLSSYIIYELHAGTFSDGRDFDGIKNKLDYLVDLGVTAIEIMPVGQFPGSRNWGYDGVYPFAVQDSYGGPAKLQELVDACHSKGIAVVLDVIYNHLGPEGNYLGEFGPYFTDKYKTPWGKALNFDDAWCDGVRRYFVENALMWFRDFHIDALRMDAVHAIKDLGPKHIIKEIREHVNELSAKTGRPYYMIAEMDLNDPIFINPLEKGGYGADAQWIDEFHHALRVSSGEERKGYYSDFDGVQHLAKSYNDAYVYDGQFSDHRKKFFGTKTDNAGHQFVVFSQNHDHTGNRMLGERTSQLVSFEMCKLLAGAVMISPYIPMLFMGEEYAEPNPFLYFISHTDEELAALVNKGRKEEFSSFKWEGEPPDPRLEETFTNSMLQWQLTGESRHKTMLDYYRQLIELRKSQPALRSTDRSGTKATADAAKKMVVVERSSNEQEIFCVLNFSADLLEAGRDLTGWTVLFDSSSKKFGGDSPDGGNTQTSSSISPESIKIFSRNRI